MSFAVWIWNRQLQCRYSEQKGSLGTLFRRRLWCLSVLHYRWWPSGSSMAFIHLSELLRGLHHPPLSLSPRLSVSQSISHTGSASDWPVMISSSSYRHPDALTVLMGAFRVSKTALFSEESVRVHALQSSVYAVKTSCYKFSAECKHVWFGRYKVTV